MESVDDIYRRLAGDVNQNLRPVGGGRSGPIPFPKNFVDKPAGPAIFVVTRLEP
jgi:hypothetical protein